MENGHKIELIEHLSQFITQNKKDKINKVIVNRTNYITIGLEDIYQAQNSGAIIRTCECFGIQNIHIIENRNRYKAVSKVTQGASKWVDIYRYNFRNANSGKECIDRLRSQGYQIIAMSPDAEKTISDLEIDKPQALIFGNEEEGLSRFILDNSDKKINIPIYGFTQSYNISVCVALSLYHIVSKLRNGNIPWAIIRTGKIGFENKVVKKNYSS